MTRFIRYFRSIGVARSVTLVTGATGATALFIWTLGFAATTLSQRTTLAKEMTEPYDCWISTARAGAAAVKGFGMQELVAGSPTLMIVPEVVAAAKASPLVQTLDAVAVFRTQVRYDGSTALEVGPPVSMGMTPASRFEPEFLQASLTQGRWVDHASGKPEAVLFESTFTGRDLPVPPMGTVLQLSTWHGVIDATLVGVTKERKWVSGFPTGFVTDDVWTTLMPEYAEGEHANVLLCRTGRPGVALALREELLAKCGEDTGIRVIDRNGLVTELQTDLLKNFARQAPLLLVLAVLMAACLVGTAVRISLQARIRVFAQYRILGMTRGQLVAFVVRELAVLLCAAWVLGSLIGFGILIVFTHCHAADFPDGIPAALYAWGPLAALLLLAVITAAVLVKPLRALFHAEPLAALSPEKIVPKKISFRRTVAGLVLVPLVLLLLLPFSCPPLLRSTLIICVGLPTHLLGLWLALPAMLGGIDHLVARRRQSVLLRHSTGRSYGRTLALIITIMAGLGSYCAIQIWGASMIAPFIPSRELPDVIIHVEPGGLPEPQMRSFGEIEGVRDFEPFDAEQYVLTDDILDKITDFAGIRPLQNNILLFNIANLPRLKFVAGSAAGLEDGGCIIPMMLARQGGFKPGDPITIRRMADEDTEVNHTWRVTGIVDVNWHLFTARAGLRGRSGTFGTLGPVFVNDPGLPQRETWTNRLLPPGAARGPRFQFAWFNLAPGASFDRVDAAFKTRLAGFRQAMPQPPGRLGELRITLNRRDEIADGTFSHGNELVGELARLPFYSLVLLTVGIVAIVQANIQSRDKEFAMLRGIGMTRRQLFALLCNEVALLLFCGVLLSLLFGLCIGWVFTAWTRAWMPFGGLPIVLHIPWMLLLKGVGLTFGLGLLYSLIPITSFMRRESP